MEILSEIETINGVIRGVIHVPENIKPKGLIVFIHGYFSSNKLGPVRLYVQLSRLFQQLGFVVWRYDIIGIGDSDGDYSNITFESHIRDIEVILSKAKKEYSSNIILCGHSSGANIALEILSNNKSISKLLLISPAFGEVNGCEPLLNNNQLSELDSNGLTSRKGLLINSNYYYPLISENIFEKVKLLFNKCHFFIGVCDQFYNSKALNYKLLECGVDSIVTIPDADHNFIEIKNKFFLFNALIKILSEGTTKVIITADDFGMCELFDKGIIEMVEKGNVTSVGIMVDRIKQKSVYKMKSISLVNNISIGLHLDFINTDYLFEIQRQYNRFIELFAQPPSYIDVHKGIKYKDAFSFLIPFVIEKGIPFRNHGDELVVSSLKQTTSPYFLGTGKEIPEILLWLEKQTPNDIIELVFHPGYFDVKSDSSYNIEREKDMKTLNIMHELLKLKNITIVNYDFLNITNCFLNN